jgi:hypothetical protein
VEEFIMLTDPKLSLFTGDEEEINEADERPQHKLTDFTFVYLSVILSSVFIYCKSENDDKVLNWRF